MAGACGSAAVVFVVSKYLSVSLRARVDAADRGFCRYCLSSEANSGLSMTYDHILPRSMGGQDLFENVCLACRRCNEAKSDRLEGVDPSSGDTVALFHPRQQRWAEHFVWEQGGSRVEGLSATGRATVAALRMNDWIIVKARERWVLSGWHPPEIETF